MTTIDVPALREAVGLRDVASGDAARARLDTLVKPSTCSTPSPRRIGARWCTQAVSAS